MNISSLARKLKTTPKELKELFPKLGFDIGQRAIQIDNKVAEKFERAFRQHQKTEKQRLKAPLPAVQPIVASLDKKIEATIKIPPVINVSELAKKLNLEVPKIIAELMKNGIMAAIHERIDYETAEIIAIDLGFKIKPGADEDAKEKDDNNIKKILQNQEQTKLKPRPPVVVVMGHVDHGKTTLLDFIRQTAVAASETGGITQTIGAYQVEIKAGTESRLITFLDTPGHEAFKGMRSRGGKIADIAILVIAADDGLKPQTLESLEVIQKENLNLIIAINKIDKEGANINKVKQELASLNLAPEDWGGKTICVEIAAKLGKNIDKLLETIILVADMAELKADPAGEFLGTIIETHLDKGLGPTATVLVHNGSLKIGDQIKTASTAGRIKAMKDFKGASLAKAWPGMPVQALGLKSLPAVGDLVRKTALGETINKINKQYKFLISQEQTALPVKTVKTADSEITNKKLNVILKSDALGSLEAVLDEIEKIPSSLAEISIIKKGLGNFTEKDVLSAEKSQAKLIGFRSAITIGAKQMLRNTQAEFNNFNIIYELLDYLKAELEKLLPPEIIETILGRAKILACFSKNKDLQIIGGRVSAGKIKTEAKFRIWRCANLIGAGKNIELQRNKRSAPIVAEGEDCGLKVKAEIDIVAGDELEFYEQEERRRTLSFAF